MAITGKFDADFAAFHTAVDQSIVKLHSMEAGAGKVSDSMNRVANSLEGGKLIQQATIMAAAVEKVGGVSKLTEKELARIGATAQEAAAKLIALGKDVPPGIQRIVDATTAGSVATGGWLPLLHALGTSWVARIAEGVLLRDAIHAVIGEVKDLVLALPQIALKGAAVADVEENFKHLTTEAGLLGDVLLGQLRAGTHNTITDFELMKTANKDLAAGLVLTDEQFGTLAKGAFALAQATGGDVASGLETMNDAMLTGRAKALNLIGVHVDLIAAEEHYAESLHKSVANLTEAGKLEAHRIAILAAVGASTDRLGKQTDGLDERVAQASTAWRNFEEDLGKTIATSATLEAAMVGVKQILIDAFGGQQKTLIEAIARAVDQAALKFVDLGVAGVQTAGWIVKEWYAASKVIGNVEQILQGDALALELAALKVAEFGAAASSSAGAQQRYAADVERIQTNITSLLVQMSKRGAALQEDDKLQAGVDARTAQYVATLEALRAKMAAAGGEAKDFVGPLNDVADGFKGFVGPIQAVGDALTQLSAVDSEYITKTSEVWIKVFEEKADLYATDTTRLRNKALADHDRDVKVAQDKGVTDVTYYTARWALYEADLKKAEFNRAELVKNSLEGRRADLAAAQAAFDALTTSGLHFNQQERDRVRANRDAAVDALHNTADEHAAMFEHMTQDVDRASFAYRNWLANVATDAEKAKIATDGLRDSTNQAAAAAKKAAEELAKLRAMGGSFALDALTDQQFTQAGGLSRIRQIQAGYASLPGRQEGHGGATGVLPGDLQAWQTLLEERRLFAQLLAYVQSHGGSGSLPGHASGISNASAGHWAMVGEQGPEPMYVPRGSTILPSAQASDRAEWDRLNALQGALWLQGRENTEEYKSLIALMEPLTPVGYGGRRGDSPTFHNTFFVNGTAEDTANQMFDTLMTQLKSIRKYPAA